jgi:amidase
MDIYKNIFVLSVPLWLNLKTYFMKKFYHYTIIFLTLTTMLSCRQLPETADHDAGFSFLEMDISTLQQTYADGRYTVEEVTRAYLNRIDAIDKNGPQLNAVLILNPDAIAIARALDAELREGRSRGPLHGVPVLLKDNIDTRDPMPTTAGSRAMRESMRAEDSYVAQKLREAGAVILGKTNLSEWANFRGQLSSSGWSSLGGQTKNPYILDRNPCGSSSGSGVAVSANLGMFAIGTETNGSIVCPSHANGIVGIKPTLGLISRRGIIPIAFSLDIAGPMTRSVRDAALVLGVLAGTDEHDRLTLAGEGKTYTDYTQFLKEDGLAGKRIGLWTSSQGTHFKVDSLMKKAVEYMKSQGATIIEIDRVSAPGTANHAFQVMLYEYKDGLNTYFSSLGPDAPVKNLEQLIAMNTEDPEILKYFNQAYLVMAQGMGGVDSKDYQTSLAAMHKGARKDGIDRVMNEHKLDAIIAPTGSPAWKTDWVNGDHFQLGSSSPAAHAGYPNITLPMGFVDELPVGISIFGRAWSEPLLLEIAYSYEQGTKHRKKPGFRPE